MPIGRGSLPTVGPRRAVVAVLASLALAAGLLGSSPAVADDERVGTESTPVVAKPDLWSAQLAARSQGSGVHVSGREDSHTEVVANPDGTVTRTVYAGPARVRQPDGSWADIDTTLVSTGGQVVPTRAGAKVELSAGGSGPVASLETSRRFLSRAAAGVNGSPDLPGVDPDPSGPTVSAALEWPTGLPAPTLDGSVARYPDVADGVDLLVSALPTGFEVSIVLKTRPAGPVNIELPFNLDGLSMRVAPADEGGGLQLVDSKNRIVGQGGSAVAFDTTTGDDGLPLHRTPVPLAVAGSGASTVVTVSPPTGFLTDAQTVFPVTIDPGVVIGPDKDTYVESDLPTTNFGSSNKLMVGKLSNGVARSYLRFPGAEMPGTVVNSAQLMLWNWASPTCVARTMMVYPAATGTWNPNKLTWNGNGPYTKPPALNPSPSAAVRSANGADGCPANWMGGSNGIDVSAIAQGWNTGMANYGIGLVAADETQYNASWQFRSSNWGGPYQTPRLIVNYTTWPTVPTNLQVAQITPAGWVPTLTPTLTATPNSPDGGQCGALFEVTPPEGSGEQPWSGQTPLTSTCGQPQSITVPAGILTPYRQYTWKVTSVAPTGLKGPVSASGLPFKPDANAPGTVFIASDTYHNGGWSNSVTAGTSTTFTFTRDPQDTDVVAYRIHVDGGPAQDLPATGADQSATLPWVAADGWHQIDAKGVDQSGNVSAILARFEFGSGNPALDGAGIDQRSATTFPVTATGAAPADTATVQYLDNQQQWVIAPGSFTKTDGNPWANGQQGNTTASGNMVSLTGNPGWAPDPGTFNRPTIINVRVCFANGAGTPSCSQPQQWQWVRHGFGGNFATAPAGPGQVALSTGELALGTTDATLPGTGIAAGRTWLSLSNTTGGIFGPGWTPALPTASSGAAASTPVYDQYQQVIALNSPDGSTDLYGNPTTDQSGNSVYHGLGLTTQDGTSLLLNQARTLLTFVAPSGASTTWTVTAGSGGSLSFTLATDETPVTAGATGYATHTPTGDSDPRIHYTAAGRWMNSGTATDCADDPVGAVGRRGCRVMKVVLSPANTTAPTTTGPFANQVDHIDAIMFDPDTNTMVTKTLAQYEYTSTGLLAGAWNPQLTPLSNGPLKTRYTYTGTGSDLQLTEVSPASADGSLKPWTFTYDNTPGARLNTVTRQTPAGDSATTSIFWGLALTGWEGLPAMDPATVASWGQDFDNAPASGVAVFGPNPNHTWTGTPQQPAAGDWQWAALAYLNNVGAPVNTAAYGAGAWQIDTVQYDILGQVTSTLSAANRAAALPEPGPDCTLPPIVCATTGDSAARADLLSTITIWDKNNPGVVTDTWGPTTTVPTTIPAAGSTKTRTATTPPTAPATRKAATGGNTTPKSTGKRHRKSKRHRAKGNTAKKKAAKHESKQARKPGKKPKKSKRPKHRPVTPAPNLAPAPAGADPTAPAGPTLLDPPAPTPGPDAAARTVADAGVTSIRLHTNNTYNEGLPANLVQQFRQDGTQLLTTTKTGIALVSGEYPQGQAGQDRGVRTSTFAYDPVQTGSMSGWLIRQPTTSTLDMGSGPDLVSRTVFDQFGNTVLSMPPSDTAGTTAASTKAVYYTADSSATLPACDNHPEWEGISCATGPAAQPTLGTSLPWSWTTSLDWWGNPLTVRNAGPDGTGVLRTTKSTFDTAGRATGTHITSTLTADVPVPASSIGWDRNTGLPLTTTAGGETVSTGWDTWARPVTHTDANNNQATTTFDLAGRVSTRSDGKGTTSFTYDQNGEHRGLPTTQTTAIGSGIPGVFTVQWDAGGRPALVTNPNGVTETRTHTTLGQLATKVYNTSDGTNLLAWARQYTAFGQVSNELGPAPQGFRGQNYAYDNAGRLTAVTDTLPTGCTRRGYGFDQASNRVTKTVTTTTAGQPCPTNSSTPTSTTTSGVFNTAAQLMSTTVTGTTTSTGAGTGTYHYDTLGRTTTVPAIDTNQATSGELDLTYWADDMTATQTVGGTTTSFSHDPLGRADTQTTTVTGGATTTLTQYYAGPGDSPAWTSNDTGTGTTWDWYLPAPTGGLALTVTGTDTTPGSATLALVNPHGDITATIPNTPEVTANQISALTVNDEYGQPLTSDQPRPYQWLGAAQRSNNGQAGIIQMGARQYNPASGRFLTLDPIPGGNPNPYTYPTDPINQHDLNGQWSLSWISNTVNAVASAVRTVAQVARNVGRTVKRTLSSSSHGDWWGIRAVMRAAGKYIKRSNDYQRSKKEAGRNAPITQRDWGTAVAGVTNIGYGLAKINSGVVGLVEGTASVPFTGGVGGAVGVAYATYQTGSGAARMIRGARQITALTSDCGSYCGTGDQVARFVIGVVPGGGLLYPGSDWIDKLGSLP